MDKKKADEFLLEWRSRLGLMDWNFKLRTDVPHDEMGTNCGSVSFLESCREARVDILREREYGDRIAPFDFEKILIHELLHCKFSLLDDSGNAVQDRIVHQMIDDLAGALIDAKRCGCTELRAERDALRKELGLIVAEPREERCGKSL